MRKAQRWRYYCDFCKRAGGSASHIIRHERGCTANPHRTCGLCAKSGVGASKPVPLLVLAFGSGDAAGMKAVRELCINCPACILAAIRQSGSLHGAPNMDPMAWEAFNFKEELAAFWAEENAAQADREAEAERHAL